MRFWLALASFVLIASAAQADEARLSFARGGFWLTNPTPADFTLHQEQVDQDSAGYAKARLALYKLSDPALLAEIVTARALKSLSEAELLRRVAQTNPVWQGDLVLPKTGDIQVPLTTVTDTLGAGVYMVTAAVNNSESQRVAQWFVRSSMTVKAQFVGDRTFVAAYDTQTRMARSDVHLRWCNADGKIVGEEQLPDTGAALIKRPATAALLLATATDNAGFDYIQVPQVDRIRTVDGALVYPSAGMYEPGKPFNFLIATPGGSVPVVTLNNVEVPAVPVMPGLWRADVPPDVKGTLTLIVRRDSTTLATNTVQAMASSKLAITWLQKPQTIATLQPATFKFRMASGGKALANQDGALLLNDAQKTAQPTLQLPFKTDAKGVATITIPARALPANAAHYQVAIEGAGQRAVTDSTISAYPALAWMEIKPQFSDGAVAENVTAQFMVASRRAEGGSQAVAVSYELAREGYKFEWYQAEDGRWAYRTKTTLEKVLDGAAQPIKGVTTIAVPVSAGRYRLTVRETGGALQGEQSFTAGWWLAQPAPATPETIELSAQVEGDAQGADDKSRIAIFIDPPFAAHVWVAAMNANSGIALPMVTVPDEGGFAYLPRSTLQPGQPLLLAAYGIPSDAGASLVQAEGGITLPLGSKINIEVTQHEKGDGFELALSGLPIDQPLDKNIAQAFIALYDDADLSLWQSTKLAIDNEGKAQADFKGVKLPARIRVRVFSTISDRLNVSEQVLVTSGKDTIDKKRTR